MPAKSAEATAVMSVEVRIESRSARRCPVCRRAWPFDWEYCSLCNVWLSGTECSERRVLIVPCRSGRSSCAADVDAPLVLACEIRCPGELPDAADLSQERELLQSFVTVITVSGGTARVAAGAGVSGRWSGGLECAFEAVRAAVAGVHAGAATSARRVRYGIGISSAGRSPDARRLAFRLASLAGPDSVLACEDVYQRTRQRFDYRGVCPAVPRSDPLPGPVFEVLGAKPERFGSRHVGAERAPLVGRGELLRALDECYRRVERGKSVVLHLIGEPGSGKSRLLREWVSAADRERRFLGWLRLETDGVPYGAFPLRASEPGAVRGGMTWRDDMAPRLARGRPHATDPKGSAR
jgi:hypothetical protein